MDLAHQLKESYSRCVAWWENDVTFWLLMVGDWQASFSANEQPYFTDVFDTSLLEFVSDTWFDTFDIVS